MGDVEQILGQGARVTVEGLGIGGQAGGALDVAVLGHHALEHHQRGGAELEAVRAEQRGGDDIAGRLVRPRAAQHDLLPDSVGHQRLMHFGDTDFGGTPGVLEAGDGRGTGAAGVAGDVDDIGTGLGDADGDGADALAGDELDDHPYPGRLAVVDELGEVLDGIGVVVRWGRDQFHTGVPPRAAAICTVTLGAGSCPPSPGFAPWPILISSSRSIGSAR